MELSVLAAQAVSIACWALDKVSGGALEKAGADVLDFLRRRFQDKLQLTKTDSKLLEAAILSEAHTDNKFRENLERLVKQYQYQKRKISVAQNTESGVNLNVDHNTGQVVGQQFFR
ncbi:MAG: hypothetical protein AAFY26_05920 [Cyanobacteria bacterium J06638_22]